MAVPPHVPPDLAELAEEGSPEELLVRRIDFQRLPRHVAVIMVGNGRWA
jgi:undecaprenyl pyrophosphate synthase